MQKENLSSLVAKAQKGDNQALNDLFTATYNDVYYFALKTMKGETLAADVTQETFITIFRNISTLNDPVAYPAWSRQITYRHCLQHLKKQNREITVDENEDGMTIFDVLEEERTEFIPEENLDRDDFKKTILDMVDSLPTEQRTAVILYYYDELSIKEIAEIQGVTEGTVKSRLNYARKAIKASVESYEKKHNVKLRCAGVLPLLLWLFASDFGAKAMPAATAQTVATGVSTATGTTLSVSSVVKNGAKIAWSLWQKIAAGLAATAVAIGGTVALGNAVNKPDTTTHEDDQISAVQVVQVWEGQGGINIGLNLSDENEFTLIISRMDDDSIRGKLNVTAVDGTSYSRSFTGTGRPAEMLHAGSTFYDITLNEEIAGWSEDYPGYKEFTLRYQPEEDQFYFDTGPFEAVLKRNKNFSKNKTEPGSHFSYKCKEEERHERT